MPRSKNPPRVTHPLAERHEALWLKLSALHKDVAALAAKKPQAQVSTPVRIVAEALLCDSLPFRRQRLDRLPVAADDLAGLAVQLGQALAGLDAWEAQNTRWDARWNCRVWVLAGDPVPVKRLKPEVAPPQEPTTHSGKSMRSELERLIKGKCRGAYEDGFAAGRAARQGPPMLADEALTPSDAQEVENAIAASPVYPRLRSLR